MSITVGIPQALLYHEFGEFWQTFFASLDVPVKVSATTNKRILDRGAAAAVDESCLPLKLYLGHAESLLDQCTHLFVPRVASYYRQYYLCAKFAGLPDIVKNAFRLPAGRLISPDIDSGRPASRLDAIRLVAGAVGRSLPAGLAGFRRALAARRRRLPAAAAGPKVAVIGHSYIIRDNFFTGEIFAVLAERGVAAVTPDDMPGSELYAAARRFAAEIYWQLSAKLAGAAFLFARRPDIAGIILVSSFGCGLDSLMNEYLEHRVLRESGKPYLILNRDEHTGQAGIATRVEAFWDLVERRKRR